MFAVNWFCCSGIVMKWLYLNFKEPSSRLKNFAAWPTFSRGLAYTIDPDNQQLLRSWQVYAELLTYSSNIH